MNSNALCRAKMGPNNKLGPMKVVLSISLPNNHLASANGKSRPVGNGDPAGHARAATARRVGIASAAPAAGASHGRRPVARSGSVAPRPPSSYSSCSGRIVSVVPIRRRAARTATAATVPEANPPAPLPPLYLTSPVAPAWPPVPAAPVEPPPPPPAATQTLVLKVELPPAVASPPPPPTV